MKVVLTADQESLHQRALGLARKHRAVEAALVRALIEIDRLKLYLPLGFPSLFQYAVSALQMSEKARSVPALAAALDVERLSVAKASRIASALDAGNAQSLIEFAATHTARETEREAAKLKPRARKRDTVREVDGEMVEIRILIPKDALADLERVQALEAQRGRDATLSASVIAAAKTYLRRRDPVAKARRAHERRTFKVARRRAPIKAGAKHEAVARDGGRCAFVGADGKRCGSDRWLHLHHVVPVARGGTNDPTNLVCLRRASRARASDELLDRRSGELVACANCRVFGLGRKAEARHEAVARSEGRYAPVSAEQTIQQILFCCAREPSSIRARALRLADRPGAVRVRN